MRYEPKPYEEENYEYVYEERPVVPSWLQRRSWVVPLILGLNILVFLGWNLANRSGLIFFERNFYVSTAHLEAGHVWTLLTSAFSHNQVFHLFFNMIVLYSFGGLLERLLGVKQFVLFYMTAALVSSLSHCLVSSFLLGNGNIPALGASGALAGLLIVFSLIFPKHRILLFGILPLPAIVGAVLFVGLDIWGLVAQSRGGGLPIGHGAHLGGAFCGAVYYWGFLRKRLQTIPF